MAGPNIRKMRYLGSNALLIKKTILVLCAFVSSFADTAVNTCALIVFTAFKAAAFATSSCMGDFGSIMLSKSFT